MGFDASKPRQLAPTVGKMQVGSMVSAVPAPALADLVTSTPPLGDSATSATKLDDWATLMESTLFGSLGFIPHLPILQSAFADLHAGADLTFGGFRIYVNK